MSVPPKDDNALLGSDPPKYRPRERFWPYVELPEQLTDEEIAALDPDLHAELFGTPPRPLVHHRGVSRAGFSRITRVQWSRRRRRRNIAKPAPAARFAIARGSGRSDAVKLRDLFELVGRFDQTEVLVDDRPVPFARELWLPLIWFLIPR